MSKKNFKIARKPGLGNGTQAVTPPAEQGTKARPRRTAAVLVSPTALTVGITTRKTIEVPEDFFRRVKIRAVERGILEKELWAEILGEYFENHPTA